LLSCLAFASCRYDDYEVELPDTSVLFNYQNYNRNLVVGEGLDMEVGVVFAGVLNNKLDRTVRFEIDQSMVPVGKTLLPASLYTLGNQSEIVVPKGSLKGYLPMKLDSLAFLADAKALTGEYVFPIKITSVENIDVVNEAKNYMVISVSYFGKQHGNYTYSGTRTGNGETKNYNNVATSTNSVRKLTTVGPTIFRVEADPEGSNDPNKGVCTFLVDIPIYGGGAVTISADPASKVAVSPDGTCEYDVTTKTLTLNYKYTVGDVEWKASDRMVFRNRIRDVQSNGLYINEWRGF
jgi:hypothetical protein